MNSALKPVLPQPGVPQTGGQASPAKGNVAGVNHSVGHPQGAQNSLHHGTNNIAGQNLTHHQPVNPLLPLLPHAAPSMAPVSANMAQMAHNMSHHGNLSHVTQNSVTPANTAASPNKGASTSAPLSLVQDKPAGTPPAPSSTPATSSQPLALTRTPEKKEGEPSPQANGTVESPKTAVNASPSLKPQNSEPLKEKQDVIKTSPSTPKPPEKPSSAPNTPQKTEATNAVGQADGPAQAKVAPIKDTEKSPSKAEPKPAPTADVAPSQSDNKPAPESANDSQEKPPTPKPEPKIELPKQDEKEEKSEKPKEEIKPVEPAEEKKIEKVQEKVLETERKPEVVKAKPEPKVAKSTIKLATVNTPVRKRRQPSEKTTDGPTPAKKLAPNPAAEGVATPESSRSKRSRTQVQLYQSPTPELTMATKLSASAGRSTPTKQTDDKLIVFYKNEYLAVRNAEGGFYVCQAVQNVYRNTRKIKIRWLSQDKSDSSGETYKPDFYDVTDMECVLTTLSLTRSSAGQGAQLLKPQEEARAKSILERALKAEQSGDKNNIEVTEEHPDGLDLSLYKDESQLEKKSRKRKGSKTSPRGGESDDDDDDDSALETTPTKKSRTPPKRSPRSAQKKKNSPNIKGKTSGSTNMASTRKVGIVQRIYRNTATAVVEQQKTNTPIKKTPVKPKPETPKSESPVSTPKLKARRATKDSKPSPIVPTPSTSTGKTTRTPRKPPTKK